MSDDIIQQCSELTEKNKKLEGEKKDLQKRNRFLSQHQWTAIASYFGVLIVTVLCGLSVAFITIDKSKAAVLVVIILCWTGLAAMSLLLLAQDKKDSE